MRFITKLLVVPAIISGMIGAYNSFSYVFMKSKYIEVEQPVRSIDEKIRQAQQSIKVNYATINAMVEQATKEYQTTLKSGCIGQNTKRCADYENQRIRHHSDIINKLEENKNLTDRVNNFFKQKEEYRKSPKYQTMIDDLSPSFSNAILGLMGALGLSGLMHIAESKRNP